MTMLFYTLGYSVLAGNGHINYGHIVSDPKAKPLKLFTEQDISVASKCLPLIS